MPSAAKISGPRVYFIRHGETDWNVAGRLQGQQDTPLNARGRHQAEQVGLKLAGLVERPADLPYLVSPMLRTRETAEILLRTIGVDPAVCRFEPRLKEIAFGQWEGLTWKQVRAADPDRARLRDMDKWGAVSPGGESYAMVAGRIAPVFTGLTGDVAIVSHGGIARAALVVMNCIAKEDAPTFDVWQGRILVIGNGGYRWV